MDRSNGVVVGKCVIIELPVYDDSEEGHKSRFFTVQDYSGAWLGSFPTFVRAENYAKRESSNI